MVMDTKIVKYAGVSISIDQNGKRTAHFHSTNTDDDKAVMFHKVPQIEGVFCSAEVFFIKLPPNTTKPQAVQIVLSGLVEVLRSPEDRALAREKLQKILKKAPSESVSDVKDAGILAMKEATQ